MEKFNSSDGIFWMPNAWLQEKRRQVPIGCQLSFDFPEGKPIVRINSIDKDTGAFYITVTYPAEILSFKVVVQ